MIPIKNSAELQKMRVSGRIAARVRDRLAESVRIGVTTDELDRYAAELIRTEGAESAFLGYRGYPGHICLSVNDEVVNGIPGKRRIDAGDIVSIDVGVRFDGFIGDTAITVMAGVCEIEVARLVATAELALKSGIAQVKAGQRVSDISHAIENVAVHAGFSVVRDFVGHGVGRDLHEEPQVPNFGKPGCGAYLKDGMTIAVEPMVNLGCGDVEVMDDGWTVLTADRKPSAHFEHTVAVMGDAPEILTLAETFMVDRADKF